MTLRANIGRCLLLFVAVGLAAQAVALATHPRLEQVSTAPVGDDRDQGHDPHACGLCQILSQVRVQALVSATCAAPTLALVSSTLAATPEMLSSIPRLSASRPRAPPSSSIS